MNSLVRTLTLVQTAFLAVVSQANTTLTNLDVRHNSSIAGDGATALCTAVMVRACHEAHCGRVYLICSGAAGVVQESKTIETYSGIPVKQLKANDASLTELNLQVTGCGVAEALVLRALLKVRFSFTVLCTAQARVCVRMDSFPFFLLPVTRLTIVFCVLVVSRRRTPHCAKSPSTQRCRWWSSATGRRRSWTCQPKATETRKPSSSARCCRSLGCFRAVVCGFPPGLFEPHPVQSICAHFAPGNHAQN